MTPPVVVRLPAGDVELRAWPGWAARVLEEMIVLAGPEFPEGPAHDRLFPVATDDPDHADEWRRNVHPDLFALYASSRDIAAKDLAAAVRRKDGTIVRMRIPFANVPGWIAALNAARLHLAAAHDVDAQAMQAPLDELAPELRAVVARIDLLAELQYHLIRGADAPEPAAPQDAPEPDPPAKPRKPRKPAKPRQSGEPESRSKPKKSSKPRRPPGDASE